MLLLFKIAEIISLGNRRDTSGSLYRCYDHQNNLVAFVFNRASLLLKNISRILVPSSRVRMESTNIDLSGHVTQCLAILNELFQMARLRILIS